MWNFIRDYWEAGVSENKNEADKESQMKRDSELDMVPSRIKCKWLLTLEGLPSNKPS